MMTMVFPLRHTTPFEGGEGRGRRIRHASEWLNECLPTDRPTFLKEYSTVTVQYSSPGALHVHPLSRDGRIYEVQKIT
jgi:hypothetical protein